MSQPSFEVGSATLLTVHSHRVEQVRQEIMGQLQTLISELEPLAVHWHGGAAAAFVRLKSAYRTQQVGIDKVLGEIAQALSGSQTTYNNADATSQDTLARVERSAFTLTPGRRS